MGGLISEVAHLEIKQATSATVAMNLLVSLHELVRIMDSGLEMHQLVKVNLFPFGNSGHFMYYFQFQYCAPPYPIHLMGELISAVANLELEQFILVTVAMNLLGNLRGPVRTMDSGLERHQLVKVSSRLYA